MNHLKTQRRSLLGPKFIDSTLRLRINRVKRIEEFPAVLYAKKWIQAGNARSDSGLGRKRVEEFDLGEIDEDLD